MKWDVNTVISSGLVVMGVMSVGGWIALSMRTGTSSGTEIPIAIISGLVGVLTGKHMAESQYKSKTAETLDKISTVAEEGKNIANAVEAIKQIGKKG